MCTGSGSARRLPTATAVGASAPPIGTGLEYAVRGLSREISRSRPGFRRPRQCRGAFGLLRTRLARLGAAFGAERIAALDTRRCRMLVIARTGARAGLLRYAPRFGGLPARGLRVATRTRLPASGDGAWLGAAPGHPLRVAIARRLRRCSALDIALVSERRTFGGGVSPAVLRRHDPSARCAASGFAPTRARAGRRVATTRRLDASAGGRRASPVAAAKLRRSGFTSRS